MGAGALLDAPMAATFSGGLEGLCIVLAPEARATLPRFSGAARGVEGHGNLLSPESRRAGTRNHPGKAGAFY